MKVAKSRCAKGPEHPTFGFGVPAIFAPHHEPLRLASGEIAAWQNGYYVASDQGEWWQMGSLRDEDSERAEQERSYAGIDWQIGVVQLADGTWLANPPGWGAWNPRFPTREAALRRAAAGVIRRARYLHRMPRNHIQAFHSAISAEAMRTVICWAFRILGRPAPRERNVSHASSTSIRIRRGYQPELFEGSGWIS